MRSHEFTDPKQAADFILAGRAIFTCVSQQTGMRYTFKTERSDTTPGVYFVSYLMGPSNTADYMYLGVLEDKTGEWLLRLTKKSRLEDSSTVVKAFRYVTRNLLTLRRTPPDVEVWHEGRCGRCGRTLTVPESIASGLGPTCAGKGGF